MSSESDSAAAVFLMASLAERRALRTEILASSPLARAALARSRRRSSVSGGIEIRIASPLLVGFRPSPASVMPFSMAPIVDLSHGWTVIRSYCGALTFETWLSGIELP